MATLRYSRRSFRRVVWKSGQQVWAELHEQAWRYFGGSTRYVVLDNLKEGVLKPDLYEPELNPVFAATLAYYEVVAHPARVRDPNRKGTVENAIGHTQATALKGRRFETIEEQNTFLEHWETKWAASRIHGSERRQVQARSPDGSLLPQGRTGRPAQRCPVCGGLQHQMAAADDCKEGGGLLARPLFALV